VSGPTWGVGTAVNVSWAVAIGVYFGWTRQGFQALVAVVLGTIVTILGLDLLLLVPTPAENAHFGLLGFVAFDSIGLFVALIGMSILIGGGALTGVLIHLTLSRTGCLARIKNGPKPRTGMFFLRPNRFDAMLWSGLSDAGSLTDSAMYG
jgi:predicted small integral membrane protein